MGESWCPWRLEVSDLIDLKLQVVVNLTMWVLGTKFRSSAGTVGALKH